MGHYTELKCTIKLKKATPDIVIDVFQTLIDNPDDMFDTVLDHDFFKCESWYLLLLSSGFDGFTSAKMSVEKGCWVIDIHSEFKNYDNEIEKFIDWISPFVKGKKKKEYVGWFKSESMDERTNIYIERL